MVRAQIQPVIGGILGNQIDLFHAVREQRLRLSDNVSLLPAAVRPAHSRYGAEAARMIAAFGNSQVRSVTRRQAKTRSGEIRDVRWPLVDLHERAGKQ